MQNADLRATRGILETLFHLSPERNMLYVTDTHGGIPTRKFEHLSCFYPGLLALALHTLENDTSIPARDKTLHRWAAEGLAHTCWTMYHESESGLGPEEAQFESRVLAGASKTQVWAERWMSHVWRWEEEGRPAGKPPGVANLAKPVRKEPGVKRDYTTHASPYYLRPEVGFAVSGHIVLKTHVLTDDRVDLSDVEADGRRSVARAGMGDIQGHRATLSSPCRIRQCIERRYS